MNVVMNNKWRMIKTTQKTLTTNSSVWGGFVKFGVYKGQLDAEIVIIDNKENLLMEIDRGPKKEKERLRMAMVRDCLKVSSSGYAFADDTEDTLLATKMEFTKSDLLNLVDSEQANKAEMVYNVIHPILASLEDYNILPLDLTNLKNSVEAYRDFLTAPKNSADTGAGLREELEVHIAKCMWILKKMDRLMEHFKENNNEFVTVYTKSRVIVDLGHRYKKAICDIAGVVKNLATSAFEEGVSVYILGDEKHGVKTDVGGAYILGAYQDGEVVLVFEKEGFDLKEVPLLVIKKENQEVNVSLKPVDPVEPPPGE